MRDELIAAIERYTTADTAFMAAHQVDYRSDETYRAYDVRHEAYEAAEDLLTDFLRHRPSELLSALRALPA